MTKCIVITTINNPTEQIMYYSTLSDWKLIIVGDSKTNDDSYKNINCIYLGLREQELMYPLLYNKLSLKSYTRKMFGYLYAIDNGFNVIYDTDDDNQYIGDINMFQTTRNIRTSYKPGFVNLYKLFTCHNIWPRGIPPGHISIQETPPLSEIDIPLDISIIQGLVNNDPDVDAYYRININDSTFTFEIDNGFDIILNKLSVCPFNTQNTFWIDKSMFYAMYLPTTVTFRYTDILRGFVALFQLWKYDKTIKFTLPTAYQKRNPHDLQKDYDSEIPMYNTAEQVIALLSTNYNATIIEVYSILADNGIVDHSELEILKIWMSLVKTF